VRFKNVSKKFDKNDFELYDRLTDQSSEIEALFIERTKQLFKRWWNSRDNFA